MKFLKMGIADWRSETADLERSVSAHVARPASSDSVELRLRLPYALPQAPGVRHSIPTTLDATPRKRMSGRARLTPLKIHGNIRVARIVVSIRSLRNRAQQAFRCCVQVQSGSRKGFQVPQRWPNLVDLKSTLNLPKTDFP